MKGQGVWRLLVLIYAHILGHLCIFEEIQSCMFHAGSGATVATIQMAFIVLEKALPISWRQCWATLGWMLNWPACLCRVVIYSKFYSAVKGKNSNKGGPKLSSTSNPLVSRNHKPFAFRETAEILTLGKPWSACKTSANITTHSVFPYLAKQVNNIFNLVS